MAQKNKSKTPVVTEQDREVMLRVLTDMQLHGTHPLIASGVKAGVSELLRLAGRQDLADVWDALL